VTIDKWVSISEGGSNVELSNEKGNQNNGNLLHSIVVSKKTPA
jgi:hypothetical protein